MRLAPEGRSVLEHRLRRGSAAVLDTADREEALLAGVGDAGNHGRLRRRTKDRGAMIGRAPWPQATQAPSIKPTNPQDGHALGAGGSSTNASWRPTANLCPPCASQRVPLNSSPTQTVLCALPWQPQTQTALGGKKDSLMDTLTDTVGG